MGRPFTYAVRCRALHAGFRAGPVGGPLMSPSAKNSVIRIAGPLRQVLEIAAQQDGRTLSSMVPRILVDFAATQISDRAKAA